MKRITRLLPLNKFLIIKRLVHIVITEIPMEFGCLIASYLIHLQTKQSEWLYYGIPIIIILHYATRTKYHHAILPILYFVYMASVHHLEFPNTLLCTSTITALAYLCLANRSQIATRIHQLNRNFIISAYYSLLTLLGATLLYIISSIFITSPDILKELLCYVSIFIFSSILPSFFLAIDKYRKDEPTAVPAVIRWTHLLIVETGVIGGTIYLGYSILLMTFNSLTPRPYVIYIVIATILTIEICAKLHEWAPRNWNSLFFQKRNLIYIPLTLLGAASLYIEFSLVGFTPRTLTVSILLAWIATISISRLTEFQYIAKNVRVLSLYLSVGILVATFALTMIQ